jgi:hypothetical protein
MRMMLDLRIFFHVERETVKAFIFNLNPPADGGFGRETRVQVAAALEGEERASSLISIPSSCRSRRSCGAPARASASSSGMVPGRTSTKASSRKAKMGWAAKSASASQKSGKAITKGELTLQKPTAISGRPVWFVDYYKDGSQKERDRNLFSR